MIASIRCPKLVGRAEETAFLRARLGEADLGVGSLTFISGDAGIGKTRLVGDFLQLPEVRRIPRAFGHCLEHARAPLAPLADIVWSLIDENPTILDDAPGTRSLLAPLVPSIAPEGNLPGGSKDVRSQYAGIIDLFRRVGDIRPLVIVIEDAEWADLSTVEFIAFFATRLTRMRVVMIVLHRQTREGALLTTLSRIRSNRSVYTMNLEPLSIGEMRQFSTLALGSISMMSATTLERVHELADGNPLFAEELLGTALVSSGDALPDSLRSLFLDRIRDIDADDRETLTEAAVMGRSFDPTFLAQLTGRPIERILRTLRRARELQIVDDDGAEVVFRHALIRETLYASLMREEARRLHRRMAEELERLPESLPRAAALAYHWWAARDSRKSFDANVLAGDRAAAQFTTADAVIFYKRALSSTHIAERTRAEIECKLGLAAFSSGYIADARAAYTHALETYRTIGDLREIALASMELGRQYAALADGEQSIGWRTAAIAAAEEYAQDLQLLRTTVSHAAFALATQGDVKRAQTLIERAGEIACEVPIGARIDLDDAAIMCDVFTGRHADSEKRFAALSIAAENVATLQQIVRIYGNSATINEIFGEVDLACERGRIAVERCDRGITPGYHVVVLGVLGMALLKAGDVRGSQHQLEYAQSIVDRYGQHATRFTAPLASLGIRLGIHLGDALMIERYCVPDVLENAFTSREHMWSANVIEAFIRAAILRGEPETARAIMTRAVQTHCAAPMTPDVYLLLVEFAVPTDAERARELFARWPNRRRAITAYGLLGEAIRLRRIGDAHASLARDASSQFESLRMPLVAARALEVAGDPLRAIQVYERVGARGDVDRLSGRGADPLERRLSAREREVLSHIEQGRANAEIARVLHISERTVESHVRSILAKRGVKSRLQLMRLAGG
jgi:DNA-binding NarL/FixJ family response regulator